MKLEPWDEGRRKRQYSPPRPGRFSVFYFFAKTQQAFGYFPLVHTDQASGRASMESVRAEVW